MVMTFGTLEQNRDVDDVINNNCAFPTMTSPNVCCEKSVFDYVTLYCTGGPAIMPRFWQLTTYCQATTHNMGRDFNWAQTHWYT